MTDHTSTLCHLKSFEYDSVPEMWHTLTPMCHFTALSYCFKKTVHLVKLETVNHFNLRCCTNSVHHRVRELCGAFVSANGVSGAWNSTWRLGSLVGAVGSTGKLVLLCFTLYFDCFEL